MLQRNTTVYQTKASWFLNRSGAFVVLFCPGTQAGFYVVPYLNPGADIRER